MAKRAFAVPEHWEDWLGAVLGVWLCISPWVLQYNADGPATQNAVVMGVVLIAAEIVILSAFRAWEEWINVAIGVWLVVSPWALGIGTAAATVNFVAVGVVALALALYELWDTRRHLPHPA